MDYNERFQVVMVGFAILCVVGFGAFLLLVRSQRHARRFLRLPVTPIGALVEGTVARVDGWVTSPNSLTAPISERACVAWMVVLIAHRQRGHRRRVVTEVRHVSELRMSDGSHEIALDMSRTLVTLTCDHVTWSPPRGDLPEPEARFLARYGFHGRHPLLPGLNAQLSFEESALLSQGPMSAIGTVGRDATGQLVLRASPTEALHFTNVGAVVRPKPAGR
jgi:hypothetical protein